MNNVCFLQTWTQMFKDIDITVSMEQCDLNALLQQSSEKGNLIFSLLNRRHFFLFSAVKGIFHRDIETWFIIWLVMSVTEKLFFNISAFS